MLLLIAVPGLNVWCKCRGIWQNMGGAEEASEDVGDKFQIQDAPVSGRRLGRPAILALASCGHTMILDYYFFPCSQIQRLQRLDDAWKCSLRAS